MRAGAGDGQCLALRLSSIVQSTRTAFCTVLSCAAASGVHVGTAEDRRSERERRGARPRPAKRPPTVLVRVPKPCRTSTPSHQPGPGPDHRPRVGCHRSSNSSMRQKHRRVPHPVVSRQEIQRPTSVSTGMTLVDRPSARATAIARVVLVAVVAPRPVPSASAPWCP